MKKAAGREGRRKKKPAQQRNELANLAGKLAQNELLQDREVVFRPTPEVKMSAVMWDFVEPYLEQTHGYDNYQKLFTLAVGAWNIALIPEEEQAQALDKVVAAVSLGPAALKDLRQTLAMMVERKRVYFADNRRFIVEYHLFEATSGLQLAVVSLPPHD